MAHGGARNGAGRKKGAAGAATEKTREVANQLSSDGAVTPLLVMVEAMRKHYDAGNLDRAAAIAKDAAPYMHPRLAAIEHSGAIGTGLVEDDNWYGRNGTTPAGHHDTAGAGASGADPPASGQDEGGGVRPALGQDGAGSNGHG